MSSANIEITIKTSQKNMPVTLSHTDINNNNNDIINNNNTYDHDNNTNNYDVNTQNNTITFNNDSTPTENELDLKLYHLPANSNLKAKTPTRSITKMQYFYIFIFNGIGNAFISSLITFGINYGMNQNSSKSNMDFWEFPLGAIWNILVTVIIESTLSFLIGGFLLSTDVIRKGKPCPAYEADSNNKLKKIADRFPRLFFGLCCYTVKDFFAAIFCAAIFCVGALFVFFIPTAIAMGIITACGTRTFSFTGWYIFISVYTAVIGFLEGSFVAYLGLIACCKAIRRKSLHYKLRDNVLCSVYDNDNESITESIDSNGAGNEKTPEAC
eukprot:Pgem_evm1s1146